MLNKQEIERYARHLVLKEVGGAGQTKLKATKLLVLGAGGLGCPLLLYLAAAGVGTIGIIDDDVVSLSNLQRQVLYKTDDVGLFKVDVAASLLRAQNPHVEIITHKMRLTKDNASDIISQYDMVVDGCDNFDTRYIVADACEAVKVPLIMGMIGRFDGYITSFKPYENNNPRYRDLYPEMPTVGLIPACSEAGVIGALTGVIGSILALEAIKEICAIGKGLVGVQLMINTLSWEMDRIEYARG